MNQDTLSLFETTYKTIRNKDNNKETKIKNLFCKVSYKNNFLSSPALAMSILLKGEKAKQLHGAEWKF